MIKLSVGLLLIIDLITYSDSTQCPKTENQKTETENTEKKEVMKK